MSTIVQHFHLLTPHNTLSRIRSLFNPRKAIAMDLGSQEYTLRLVHKVVAPEVLLTLPIVSQLGAHPMAIVLVYFLHLTQRLGAVCQKRTKMLRFN